VVLAALGFVGFESAAALGAEAKDPHRAIPRAVLTSAVVVGVLYLFAAYVSILGLGADTLGSSGAPMDDLAQTIGLSGFRYVIDLGVAASFFAVIIASINAAARILYTMAHERILAAPLRLTHVRHRTPHIAILVLLPIILLVPAVMVIAGVTPINVYAYTGTIGTFGYLTAYLLNGPPSSTPQPGTGFSSPATSSPSAAWTWIVQVPGGPSRSRHSWGAVGSVTSRTAQPRSHNRPV